MSDLARHRLAADAILHADALLITAGAGMGVDSGLPDFRGTQGFWNAYPAYAKLELDFASIADPRWFSTDPELAWGFYGHRLGLYRSTRPHAGFGILSAWAAQMRRGAFVLTSNVDGAFQRAGYDPASILEVHGAIDWMQCTAACGVGIFSADPYEVEVDPTTFRACSRLPKCPSCGALARPNVLMFGDYGWDGARSEAQRARFDVWRGAAVDARIVVVECGAGTAIPTVRRTSEAIAARGDATLIRINVREPEVPPGHIGIGSGALAALRAIDALVRAPS